MSPARRSVPVALVLLALLAALSPSAAAVGSPGATATVDTGTPPADAECCCEGDPACGSPASPCAPAGDCCAACAACSLRVVPASGGPEPDRASADEPDPPREDQTVGVGLGGDVWHPPRG